MKGIYSLGGRATAASHAPTGSGPAPVRLPAAESLQKLYSSPPGQIADGCSPESRSGISPFTTSVSPRAVVNLNPSDAASWLSLRDGISVASTVRGNGA